MPKFPTSPTLYDDALQISISKLKAWGYLKPKQILSGTLNWSVNGNHTGSISIQVNTNAKRPYIELDYKFKDEPRNYKVWFASVSSNLGKGEILYFLCPHTNKRCRKLYSIGGYFLHREAFNGCMYDSQTKSKSWRNLDKEFGVIFKTEKLYDKIYSKHFKTHYKGKPTKRYLRLMDQIKKIERISYSEMEQAILS